MKSKKKLKAENAALREDAIDVMIREMSFRDGNIKIELETGITRILADHVKDILDDLGAENFITANFVFQGETEKYYMTMGRCSGKTVSEKYLAVCAENEKLREALS